jgi:hypothetical protein
MRKRGALHRSESSPNAEAQPLFALSNNADSAEFFAQPRQFSVSTAGAKLQIRSSVEILEESLLLCDRNLGFTAIALPVRLDPA